MTALAKLPVASTHAAQSEAGEAPTTDEVIADASNASLLRCLDAVLNDVDCLDAVANRSYRHQLGFMKFVLRADEMGGSLRLHYWDRLALAHEDVHSHCADFVSRVVLGSLTENSFSECTGDSCSRFRYRFDALAGHAIAVADGFTDVWLIRQRRLSSGDTYSKLAADLHNITDPELGTVTVSLWDERTCEATVLKGRDAKATDCAASTGMEPNVARSALECIRQRLVRG